MRRTVLTLMLMTASIAACSEKPGDKTGEIAATDAMSKAQVKAQVDKVQLKPGQWEGRFTVKDLDLGNMPGASANMKEQMKSAMNQTALNYCITPEQAANPSGEMFAGQENKNCTYAGFEAKGGTVKGQVSCKSQGGTMNATMSGTYAPESYAMDMDMKTAGGPQGAAMAITARSEGKWITDRCKQGQ